MKHLKQVGGLFLKSIGTADIIPSISSGTIALLIGIYAKLLSAIYSFDKIALQLLKKRQWIILWNPIQDNFLLPLVCGIVINTLTIVHLLQYPMAHYTIKIGSFFFGSSLAAVLIVYQKIKKFTFKTFILSVIGIALGYLVMQITPVESADSPWIIFVAGMVAIFVVILPGILGSFILSILGKYDYMLAALERRDFFILALFLAGGLLGLLTFSRLLFRIFKRYPDETIALLAGFMMGSLPKTWPWKKTINLVDSITSTG